MNEIVISPPRDTLRAKRARKRALDPTRTCVGCGERASATRGEDGLIRLILGPGGEIAVDARGGGFGRGAHVHARPECLRRAVERGLSRSAKARVHSLHSEAAGAAVPAIPFATGPEVEIVPASATIVGSGLPCVVFRWVCA